MKAKLTILTSECLALCRHAKSLRNEQLDTAYKELLSWIVFSSIMEEYTELDEELEKRFNVLLRAAENPQDFPKDMGEEVEQEIIDEGPDDDGPQVA